MALEYYKNYFIYGDFIKSNSKIVVYVPDINIRNIEDHIIGIENIFKDGIETDYVHNTKITIDWGAGKNCDLSFSDYWFNLFMWSMVLRTNKPIEPKHVFFTEELRINDIKNYIDKFILTKENKIKIGNKRLCMNISDGVYNYFRVDKFSMYLCDTINNEDNIALMKAIPEFYDLLHTTFDGIPFSEIKNYRDERTNKVIDIIKSDKPKEILGYEHGLANSFRAKQAVNPRQFAEVITGIGNKSVYDLAVPVLMNTSFSNGGINTPEYFLTESMTARVAQILSKMNVGTSGDFGRLLGINNTNVILNTTNKLGCLTKNLIAYEIKDKAHLSMIKNRYYRFNPNGIEYVIDDEDMSLIGKTVYLRSPMTCASFAAGKGICKKCYGDLYYTNLNVNVGKLAAELLSSMLTQTLLSAKHLLETNIVEIKWNPEFETLFEISIDTIKLIEDLEDSIPDLKKYSIIIDPEEVALVNDEEETLKNDEANDTLLYNEYITKFYIKSPNGVMTEFGSEDDNPLYITKELNTIIRRHAVADDEKVSISLSLLKGIPLFNIKINNNEISKTMNDIKAVINKSKITESLTKEQAVQRMVDLIIDGHLSIDSIHLEVILANQIVDPSDILRKPNWTIPNAPYRMITLNSALTNNPSIVNSLLYKDIRKVLYNPLSFKKHAPSYFDLFLMEQPQVFMSEDSLVNREDTGVVDQARTVEMVRVVDKEKDKNDK